MTITKLTCDECDFMVIGTDQRIVSDPAVRRHPHTMTVRYLEEDAAEELIDVEYGA
jgi:hypothetical protein